MAWRVCVRCLLESGDIEVKLFQWLVTLLLMLCVGLAMAELGSSALTSGGVSALLQGKLQYFLMFNICSCTTGCMLSPHLTGKTCSAGLLGVCFLLLLALPM